MVLKVVYYNAQRADVTRLEEISMQCQSVDIVIVTGTTRHTDVDYYVQQATLPHHKVVQFGWKKIEVREQKLWDCSLAWPVCT